MGKTWDDEMIAVGIMLAMLFTFINVDSTIGTFYAIASLAYVSTLLAKRKDWFIEIITDKRILLSAFVIGISVTFAWAFASSYVLSYATSTEVSVVDFFDKMYSYSSIPVLSTNQEVRFFIYGIAVPVIESLLFLSLGIKFFSKLLKVQIQWQKFRSPLFYKMIWVCILVGIIGSMFHYTARAATSATTVAADYALLVDFMFFSLSSGLVFKYRQLLPAMMFHIFTNSAVLLIRVLSGGMI